MRKVRGRSLPGKRKAGFTMVEMMIVVLVLGVLLEMAVPQFITARHRARQRSCMANLRQVQSAKEQLAVNMKLDDGAAVTMNDLAPDYIRNAPACPAGGTYQVQPVGTTPECSLSVGNYAHVAL